VSSANRTVPAVRAQLRPFRLAEASVSHTPTATAPTRITAAAASAATPWAAFWASGCWVSKEVLIWLIAARLTTTFTRLTAAPAYISRTAVSTDPGMRGRVAVGGAGHPGAGGYGTAGPGGHAAAGGS